MNTRIGFGFDTHRLSMGVPFFIGGIQVQSAKGAIGHSDADVLIHAICDALLGAANLRDIGYHFPDSAAELKGIDSKVLLKKVVEMLAERHFTIGNIDTTVVLQQPKLKDYIPRMQETLAQVMSISTSDISIKAKTSEEMGFIGRGEGISAYAVALIEAE